MPTDLPANPPAACGRLHYKRMPYHEDTDEVVRCVRPKGHSGDCSHRPDDLTAADALEQRAAALARRVESALELIDDLRSYTHDWDWKYGEEWDKQRAEIAASAPAEEK